MLEGQKFMMRAAHLMKRLIEGRRLNEQPVHAISSNDKDLTMGMQHGSRGF